MKEQKNDPAYPLVSLFNLENDPQESNNLADVYPDLVRELLEEAEAIVGKAPRTVRGDVVDAAAPISSQQNIWAVIRTLGTHFETVTPFGIYLDDDVDISTLDYVRLIEQNRPEAIIISLKFFSVFLILPVFLLLCILRLK